MSRIRIIPRQGIVLRDPVTGAIVPQDGIVVTPPLSSFWHRRLARADAEAKPEPAQQEET